MATLTIARRFNGPASSGNGGYTSGSLAQASGLPEPVTVRLHRPPPLDTVMQVRAAARAVELWDGGERVGTAVAGAPSWPAADAVDVETARSLEASYAGLRSHPFPTCFSCGPARAPGDGLRIFPGRLDETRVAASWTPHPSVGAAGAGVVPAPVTWAALDCVGGWSSDIEHRPMVLGEMTARIEADPPVGGTLVVVGSRLRTEGRKTFTASHLFGPDGRLLAQAVHVWVEVPPEVVARLQAE